MPRGHEATPHGTCAAGAGGWLGREHERGMLCAGIAVIGHLQFYATALDEGLDRFVVRGNDAGAFFGTRINLYWRFNHG
jgi:hypothetical protein